MRELIRVFKALSDETRIRLLKLLQQRELCVCELMQALNMTQPRVSRNLRILKDAGLVKDRREGLWVHYSLDESSFNVFAGQMLKLLKDWLNDDETVNKDMENLKKAVRLSAKDKVQVLFICTGNSARSQIAEGLLRMQAQDMADVYSGGTEPQKDVHPLAKKVMEEHGIDLSLHYAKGLDRFLNKKFDIIVTVCDKARQTCPIFPGNAIRYHWNLDDPSAVEGNEEKRLSVFRKTFEEISKRIPELIGVIQKIYNAKAQNEICRETDIGRIELNLDM